MRSLMSYPQILFIYYISITVKHRNVEVQFPFSPTSLITNEPRLQIAWSVAVDEHEIKVDHTKCVAKSDLRCCSNNKKTDQRFVVECWTYTALVAAAGITLRQHDATN